MRYGIFTATVAGGMLIEKLMEKGLFPPIITYQKDFLRTSLSVSFKKYETFFDILYLDSNKFSDNKKKIENLKLDVCLCVEWTKDFFKNEVPKFQVYYSHPALLPFYRGYGAVTEQFIQGVAKGGITIYKLSDIVDGGDILFQKEILIDFSDYPIDYLNKYVDEIVNFILNLEENVKNLSLKKQKEELSFYLIRKRNKNALIDFGRDAFSIYNHIRGYSYPYFGAHFFYNDKKYKVFKSQIEAWQGDFGATGKILTKSEDFIQVVCGSGMIRLYEIIDEKNNRVDIENTFLINTFLNER